MKPKYSLVRVRATRRSFFSSILPAALSLATLALTVSNSQAIDYWWDSDGVTPGFGSTTGTWGTSAFWSTSSAGTSATANTTITTADTINIGTATLNYGNATIGAGTVSVNKIVFGAGQTTAVTLGTSTNTMTFGGITPSITVNGSGSHTISSILAGTAGIIKDGTGTLALNNNSSTITGGLTIRNGTVNYGGTPSAVGASAITMGGAGSTGATLLGSIIGGNFARAITVSPPDSGSITLAPNTLGNSATYAGAITLSGGATLTVRSFFANTNVGTGTTTVSGGITGTGSLILENSGTGAGVTGATSQIVVSGATINHTGSIVARGDNTGGAALTTVSAVIGSNVTTFTKQGVVPVTLSGANTYTGKTTVSAGTLNFNTIGNVGAASSALGAPTTVANGTIDLGGSLTYTGAAASSDRVINLTSSGATNTITNSGTGLLTLTGGFTGNSTNLAFRGTQPITVSGLIPATHTGIVGRTDVATLTLTNPANAFTGALTVNNGTISANSIANSGTASAIGAGSQITLGQSGFNNTGTFQFTGASGGSSNRAINIQSNTGNTNGGIIENTVSGQTLSLSGGVTTGGTGTTPSLQLTGAGNGVMSGIIAGTGLTLSKAGAGTWTLSGVNTYTGTTTVSAGTLRATTSASALGAGALSLGAGTLELANDTGLSFGRNTTVTATTTLRADRLNSGSAVTHTLGTLSIGAFTMNVNLGTNVTGGTGGITFGATTLTGAATLAPATDTLLTVGAVTMGANALTKTGAGSMTASGVVSGSIAAGTTAVTVSNGLLTLSGANTFTGNIAVSSATSVFAMPGNTYTTTAPYGAAGNLYKQILLTNGGTFRLTSGSFNNNTPTATNVAGGIIFNIGTGGGVFDVASGATLIIDDGTGTGTASAASQLQGAGNLTKTGLGTFQFDDSTAYAGTITVTAGLLQPASGNAFGSSAAGTTIQSGAALNVNGITMTNAEPLTINGTGLAATPAGALTCSTGNGTWTGPITLGSNTTIGGGAGNLTVASTIDLGSNTLTLNQAGVNTLTNGIISGAGNVIVTGSGASGAASLSGANTFTGGVSLNSGSFAVGSSSTGTAGSPTTGPFGAGTTPAVFNGAQVRCGTGGPFSVGNTISIAANTTFFTVASEKTLTFTGPVTLSGGDRTLTSTVGTTVPGTSVIFNGAIDDGGANLGLIKSGAGNLTLAGANTYTGATTTNAGILNLTGTLASNTALTVSPTTTAGTTFSLNSGAANPLPSVSALTIGSASGPSTIALDLGTDTASSDSINSPNAATINGTVNIAIQAIAGFGSSSSYNLITAPSGLSGATSYALTNAPGGYTYSLTNTDSAVQLAVTPASSVALYWRGNTSNSWSAISGTNTNWFTDSAGTTNAQANPGAGNTVNFSTINAANSVGVVTTTLDNNFTVKNLVFGSDPNGVSAVTIAGGLTPSGAVGILSIAPTSSAEGINVGSNAGSITISAPVILGTPQTWTVNGTGVNGSALTVSGPISGANTLDISGLVTLSATTSTYSSTTNVPNGGILQGGATNSFSASSAVNVTGTGILRLNGFSNTILSLTGDGTVQNNHASTAATLTVGDALDQTFSGILQNGGVGTLALNKTGAGILTLSGTNTYTGGSTITAGTLRQGSAGALSGGGAMTVNGTGVFDLNGFNASVSTLSGVAGATVTDSAVGSGTSTLSITAAGTSAVAITNGASRNLALRVTNENGNFQLNNGSNTFSGGIVLTNSVLGTRMNSTAMIAGAYGTGPITIGESPTDRAGIYFSGAASQILSNPIIFNTALGTDRVGMRTDVAGVVLSGVITANLAPATFTANTATAGSFTLTNQVTGASGIVLDITSLSASATQFLVTLNNSAGTNNYQGDTVVNFNPANLKSATLQLLAPDQIPNGINAGNVIVNSNSTGIGLLSLAGVSETINGLSGSGNVASTSGTVTLTLGDNNANGNHSGAINNTSGTLSVTKIGSGTQTLSGTSNFAGALTVNGGLVAFPSSPTINGPLGNSTVVNLSGGGISYTAATATPLNRPISIGGSAGTVDVANASGRLTFDVSSSGGNLVKTGPGTAVISGSTSLNGGLAGVAVNAGTLRAGFGGTDIATVSVGATGNLDLVDSSPTAEALTLDNSAGALTLAGGAQLGFEFNSGATDSIAVGASGTAVTAGVVTLNFSGTPTAGTFPLLTAPSGLSGATYALGTAPNGFNYTINASDTLVSVTVSPSIPIYWRGGQNLSWNTLGASTANWTTDAGGITDALSKPVGADTVYFSATAAPFSSGTVIDTTLDAAFTVDSLQFTNGPTGVTAVSIAAGTGGSLTLTPASTSGGIRVLSGGGNATISAPLTVGASQTWDVDPTGSLTISGDTVFNGNVLKSNTGALTLSGNNSGSGSITLAGGTLNINSATALGTGVFTIGAGTTINTPAAAIALTNNNVQNWNGDFTFTGANTLNLGTGAVTLGSSLAVTTTASTLTVGGNIGDGGNNRNLTKSGGGTLVLSGTNTYGGLTSVTNGVLRITNGSALGFTAAGTVLSADTTLELDGSAGAITVGAEPLTIRGGGYPIPTANLGALRNIAGNNTYGGTVTMGIQSRINSDSGTLTLSNPTSVSATNLTLVVGGAGNLTVSGAIAIGTGGVAKGDAGTLTLSGASTYTGATTVSGGTLTVTSSGSVINNGSPILTVSGTNAIANIDGTYTSTGGGGIAVNSGGVMNSSGTVNISGPNSNAIFLGTSGGAGTWNVTGGSVSVNYTSNGWGLGNGGVGTLNVTGGSVNTAGSNVFNLGHAAGGTGNLNISGSGLVTVNPGAGLFRIGNNASSTGTVNLDGGTLALGRNVSTVAGSTSTFNFNGGILRAGLTSTTYLTGLTKANVRDGGARVDTNGFNITIGQALLHSDIGGDLATDGGLTKSGTGTLTLTGANTYTGATVVNGGKLQLDASAASALATSSVTVGASGTLGFTAGTTSNLSLAGKAMTLNGGTLAVDLGSVSDTITVQDFTLAANSAMTFEAVGAVSNGSTYTVLSSTNPISNSGPFTISGQTLGRVILTPTVNTNDITVTASLFEGIWSQAGGGNWSDGNPAATAGNWTNYKPTVSGDATLFGSAITAPSTVVVDTSHIVGYLRFDSAFAYTIGTNGSSNLALNNGTSSAAITVTSGSHEIAENVALLSNVGVQPAASTSLTISGNISGTGRSLQMSGAGTLVLSGSTNSYTGGTSINSGTLSLTGSLTGGGSITVSNTGVLSQTSTSVISGASAITHSSSGTSTLDGVNTNTGVTTVSAGTLILSGNRTATATGGFSIGTVAGSTGTLNVTNGTFTVGATGSNFLVGTNNDSIGVMNQSGGSLTTIGNQLLIGNNASNGTYNLTGGTLTTIAGALGVTVGTNTGSTATFNLSGTGTLNMPATSTLQICRSDNNAASSITGTFSQTGGTATVGILQMGGSGATNNANANATLSLTGGTFAATTFNVLSGGNNSNSTIIIGGSAQVTLPAFPTNTKGTSATATITFDSTTGFLSPTVASATYLPAGTFTNAYLTANGAKFDVPTGRDITVAQVLADAVSPAAVGTLTKSGVGNLTLSGANTYTGVTNVNAGIAIAGNVNAFGTTDAGTTVSSGARITFNALATNSNVAEAFEVAGTGTSATNGVLNMGGNKNVNLTGAVTLTGNALFSADGGSSLNFTGASGITGTDTNLTFNTDGSVASSITRPLALGTGSLTKTGGSTLILSGNNSYSGGTTITGGVISATTSNNALGTGAVNINGGLRLAVAAGLDVANAITITSTSGAVGRGTIESSGASGTATISGPINILGSPSSGGVFLGSAGTVLHLAGVITAPAQFSQRDGRVMYSGGGTGYTSILTTGTAIVGANNGIATTAEVRIGGSAATTLDLNGFNQSVVGVVQHATHAATIGNSSTTSDSVLTTTGTSSYSGTIVNAVSGGTRTVGVTVASGQLTLSGTNTYSGATTVNGGALVLGNASALGTSAAAVNGGSLNLNGQNIANTVNVGTAGTLTGSGSTGAATLAGTVTPGGSGSGRITMAAATVAPTSAINLQIPATGTAGINYDAITVSGALALDGTVAVDITGLTPALGQSFDLIDSTGTIDVTNFNVATDLVLPGLPGGLAWDTSAFVSSGVVSIVTGDPFTGWASGFGLTGGDAAKSADPDGDGMINLLEFATNSNPTNGGSGPRAYMKIHMISGNPVLTYTVATRAAATFAANGSKQEATMDLVKYTIEGTDDLTTWNTVVVTELASGDASAVQSAIVPALPTLDTGWEWHTFRTDDDTTIDARDFIRLKVETP